MLRILLGPPCAGKSSYIEEHAKRGDVRIDWDALAAAVDAKATGTHTDRDGAVRAVATYGRAVLANYLADKWKAERDNGSEATGWIPLTAFESIGGVDKLITAGARVTILSPGEEECLRRCEDDGRPAGTADAIRAWYADPPNVPDGWLYDENMKEGRLMRSMNMPLKVKSAAGEKAANPFGGELKDGEFIAYASTFNDEPDSYGDIVAPGAFTNTLAAWKAKDAPIPLLYGHNMHDPDFNIGHIVDAKEDEHGLLVWGAIDLETGKGAQVYRLLKSRRLSQLSFAFDVRDYEYILDEKGAQTGGLLLKDIDIHEVSLVQLGANRHTSVLAVKSAAEVVASVKADFSDDEAEALADAAAQLREALSTIEGLLDGSGASDDNDTSDDDGNAADDSDTAQAAPEGAAKSAVAAAAKLAVAVAAAEAATIR